VTASVVVLGILLAGFLIVLDRRDARAHEERQANRLERAGLLQRIQAPEQAVIDHTVGEDPEVLEAVDLNDDKSYWEART
jgi:hypothetical protein